MTLSSFSMTFPWPLLFSMTFQGWKMVFLYSTTFHDQGAPWKLLYFNNVLCGPRGVIMHVGQFLSGFEVGVKKCTTGTRECQDFHQFTIRTHPIQLPAGFPSTRNKKTRNSATADKPRGIFVQFAIAWLTPKIKPLLHVLPCRYRSF